MPFTISDDVEPIAAPESQENQSKDSGRFVISDESEQPSIGKIGQFAAGFASKSTWPADLIQAGLRASAQDVLKEMGEDSPEAQAAIERIVSKIPTQAALEKYLQERTGVRFEPKGILEKTARSTGQFLSPKGMLEGGIKAAGETIAKRGTAAAGGALAKEGLEAAGVNPLIASLVGSYGSSLAEVERKLSNEATELKKLAEKRGLAQYGFIGKEKEKLTPTITKGKAKEISKELGETSKSAIEEIIKSKHPLTALRKKGVDIESYTNKILEDTQDIAKNIKTPISLDPVISSIDKKISELNASAPSLSDVDKKFISILEEKKEAFSANPSVSYVQYLNQLRKNNADRKAFYKNPQMTHLQEAANNAYGFLNENMIKNAENAPQKDFVASLKAGNKLHQEKSNLLQTEHILKPFFEDPTPSNLNKILKNEKKEAFLKRYLGEDGINEVKEIGKYVRKAEEKLSENFIQHGESLVDIAKTIGTASLASVLSPNLASALDLGLAYSYMRGLILTSKRLRGDYLNFSKAMSSGNEKAIMTYSRKLNEDFEKEYGDPQDIIADQESIL